MSNMSSIYNKTAKEWVPLFNRVSVCMDTTKCLFYCFKGQECRSIYRAYNDSFNAELYCRYIIGIG